MKKRYFGILTLALFLILTGCGERETSQKKGSEQEDEEMAGGSLADALGVENAWKDSINTEKGETVAVNAEVTVPEVSELYTMSMSEYYYTSEDKERVIGKLFDSGSVKVDLEAVPTKENLTTKIEAWEKAIEKSKEEGMEDKAAAAVNEKKKLEDLLGAAPKASDVGEDPGDYAQDYYKGTREGKEYTLGFDMDESNNISSWIFQAVDFKEFNTSGAEGFYSKYTSQENKCSMSVEEAGNQAVKICEGLGIENMRAGYTEPLVWLGDEINGYCVTLTREISGVAVEAEKYYTSEESYLDTESQKPPFAPESITIALNDNGIVQMIYEGILFQGDMGSSVKLLSFEQIKQAFCEEIAKTGRTGHFLDLIYLRVKDEAQDGNYKYIPVWKLSEYETEQTGTVALVDNTSLINAIDGSPVDIEQQGLIEYADPEWILDDFEKE